LSGGCVEFALTKRARRVAVGKFQRGIEGAGRNRRASGAPAAGPAVPGTGGGSRLRGKTLIGGMLHDPRDPALQNWLRSLKPRTELTARYALVAKYPALRTDPGFRARIVELLRAVQPDAAELAAIFNAAKLLNSGIGDDEEKD
jgi:hypothetical protein